MSALDFMLACIGSGALFVCAAWSFKILSETRARNRFSKSVPVSADEPIDPMARRLQEIRGGRFGVPMRPPPRVIDGPRPVKIDALTAKKLQIRGPLPDPKKKSEPEGK